ncbi:MAG: ABC transporter permease [Fibrobacter sp.]|nr:ABC transporter permease [Fibrobacter sp.]
MNFLYRFRGGILGLFAVALWIFPHASEWIPASSGLLALLGIVLRVEARRVIGEHTRESEKSAPELVMWGIYAKIRHPIYLSNLCFCYALILFHLGWQTVSFAFAMFVTLFVFSLAKAEDSFLEKKFGELFLKWAERTPMFFPSSFSTSKEEWTCQTGKRSVLKAFAADRWTWVWLIFCTLLLILRRYVEVPFAL